MTVYTEPRSFACFVSPGRRLMGASETVHRNVFISWIPDRRKRTDLNARMAILVLAIPLFFSSCIASGAMTDRFPEGGAPKRMNRSYVLNTSKNTILLFTHSPTGRLAQSLSAIATGSDPLNLVLTPNGGYAYVLAATGGIWQYRVETGGQLTQISHPVASNMHLRSIAIHPSGRYVYVTGGLPENTVSQYILSEDGSLVPLASPVAAGSNPGSMAMDAKGRYLYVTNSDSDDVSQYSIQEDGRLERIADPVLTGSSPSSITIDPRTQHAYVTNFADGSVSHYPVASDGRLLPSGPPTTSGAGPQHIALHPSGRFAYIIHAADETIAPFSIRSDGSLTPMQSTLPTGSYPFNVEVDPTGAFIYVANRASGTISQYEILEDGSLCVLVPAAVFVGPGTSRITTVQSGIDTIAQ